MPPLELGEGRVRQDVEDETLILALELDLDLLVAEAVVAVVEKVAHRDVGASITNVDVVEGISEVVAGGMIEIGIDDLRLPVAIEAIGDHNPLLLEGDVHLLPPPLVLLEEEEEDVLHHLLVVLVEGDDLYHLLLGGAHLRLDVVVVLEELVLGVVLLCLGEVVAVVVEEEGGDHLPREEGVHLRLRNGGGPGMMTSVRSVVSCCVAYVRIPGAKKQRLSYRSKHKNSLFVTAVQYTFVPFRSE